MHPVLLAVILAGSIALVAFAGSWASYSLSNLDTPIQAHLNAFCAGILLAASLTHLLHDSSDTLASVTKFPLANYLCGVGFCVLALVETSVGSFNSKTASDGDSDDKPHDEEDTESAVHPYLKGGHGHDHGHTNHAHNHHDEVSEPKETDKLTAGKMPPIPEKMKSNSIARNVLLTPVVIRNPSSKQSSNPVNAYILFDKDVNGIQGSSVAANENCVYESLETSTSFYGAAGHHHHRSGQVGNRGRVGSLTVQSSSSVNDVNSDLESSRRIIRSFSLLPQSSSSAPIILDGVLTGSDLPEAESMCESHPKAQHSHHFHSISSAISLLSAFLFHSLVEGLGLGVVISSSKQPNAGSDGPGSMEEVMTVYLAIIMHKFFAAYALGRALLMTSTQYYWICMSIFSCATPVGVIVGLLLVDSTSVSSSVSVGVVTALASGTFLYISIVEILPLSLYLSQNKFVSVLLFTLSMSLFSLLALWV